MNWTAISLYTVLGILFLIGATIIYSSGPPTHRQHDTAQTVWHRSPEGIDYYFFCVEGHKMIATIGAIGGPIGECDELD